MSRNGVDWAPFKTSRFQTVAAQIFAGLVSSPNYNPRSEDGESYGEACARRACDYAEALLTEVDRREDRHWRGKP